MRCPRHRSASKVRLGILEPTLLQFHQFIAMSEIFEAARQGNPARVEELLAQGGVDLAAFRSDRFRVTALWFAAKRGCTRHI